MNSHEKFEDCLKEMERKCGMMVGDSERKVADYMFMQGYLFGQQETLDRI